jgi:hypothetical protein
MIITEARVKSHKADEVPITYWIYDEKEDIGRVNDNR